MTSEKFGDKDFREAYADTFLDTWIATQMRVLREERDLTQEKLAEIMGVKQSRISAMEDVNYGSWTLNSLKKFAHAFDLPLFVYWGTFGQLRERMDAFSRDYLKRPSFDNDPAFKAEDAPVEKIQATNETNVIRASNRFRLMADPKVA